MDTKQVIARFEAERQAHVHEFTRTRMTLDYQMTQGGQTVYYQARWVNTCSQTGPWGELVSATVVK